MKNKKIILTLTILAMSIALSACSQDSDREHEHKHEKTTTTEPETCKSAEKQTLYDRVNGKLYIGDEFTLGTYEQDNNTDNGAEDIEWIVLKKTGENEYLCISKYVLDAQVFGKDNLEIRTRWSTSYLREWLNDSFYNTAFTDADVKNLVEMSTTYYTWDSFTNDTAKYKDTANDLVRVLNYGELDEFPGCVKVSEYAKAQGAPFVDDGTREHENCSDGWYMMSYNVDDVNKAIKIHEELKEMGNTSCTLVESSRASTLTVAVYSHNRISISETYHENFAINTRYQKKYLEGVRPVICIKLVQD